MKANKRNATESGVSEDVIQTNGAKKKKKGKPKRAGAHELNNTRETETLFHSSLFRLQLDQMLSEVMVKEKHSHLMDEWLKRFQELLLSLKDGSNYPLTDQLWLKTAKVPLIQEPFDTNGKFCFSAPDVCQVIGSHDLGTTLRKPQTLVDMAVRMPTTCWERQDSLNHRYHRKRALYLCHICQAIASSELIHEMKFTYFNGNHTKPILLVTPNGKLAKRFRVALNAYPQPDQKCFRWSRFTPEVNNIRAEWLKMANTPDLPTPSYNAGIQSDLNLILNYEYLSQRVKTYPKLKESLILLKIWLKQRGLRAQFAFALSLFVCHLLDTNKINRHSSSYQIFRNTLLAIVTSKWDSEGIAISEDIWQSFDYYLSYFPIAFIDVSGYHNICWDVTIDAYERLKHEAQLTCQCLDSDNKSGFESTFMKAIPFESKFDSLLKISVTTLLKSSKVTEISNDIIDNCGDTVSAFVGHLLPLCRRTLGKRVSLIQHLSKAVNSTEWPCNQLPPHPNDTPFLTIGLLIDEEHAYNNIEKGPSADTPEAKEFKDFWGEKSELRRFQDNSICETVYWVSKGFSQKRQIVTKALEFILGNILDIPEDAVVTTASLLDPMVELANVAFSNEDTVYGTGEELALSITHKLDSLAKKLRSLDDLPLAITNVQAIDPVFRATEVFPPLALNGGKSTHSLHNCNDFDLSVEQRVPKHFRPLKLIVQLEGSGKWPDLLDAFHRVKTSFLLDMSQKLSTKFGLICYSTTDYMDVFDGGHIFRVIIASHKELLLLRQLKTAEGLTKRVESRVADELETTFEVMPKINGALSALSRTHHCYGITSRLAKRWISSQMMSNYLDEMAVDLMVANTFIDPNPYTVPNSPMTGFLRFLSLICDHNWKITPLIVNLNNELNDEMVTQITTSFTKQRPKYPPMFITSAYDKRLSQWTHVWPDSVILNRMQTLAKTTKDTLMAHMREPLVDWDPKSLFRPDLDIYDLLIELKSDQITNQNQAIDFPPKFQLLVKEFDPKLNERMPITDFDPIERFVRQLRDNYSEFALFFHDVFGGREVGVIWKPSVFVSKPFGISAVNGVHLSSTADKNGVQNVATNIEAIIEDIRVLGEGIVAAIDVRTHNWSKK